MRLIKLLSHLASMLVIAMVITLLWPQGNVNPPTATPQLNETSPSITFAQAGLIGNVTADIQLTEISGSSVILLGTSKGLYLLHPDSDESLLNFIATSGSVLEIVADDFTGNGKPDLVVVTNNTYFPNIQCYDSSTGDSLWGFSPTMEVFEEDVLWTDMQTQTIDIISIDDLNSDGHPDIAVSSGYSLYVIDGETGKQIWEYETEGNLWQILSIQDIDGDSTPDVAVGAQDGSLHVVSGLTGNRIWKKSLTEKCTVYDDAGDVFCSVERSVWDIIPVNVDGEQKALVSSEDGKVRLLNLKNGEVEWESDSLIDYVGSTLYQYYSSNERYPSGLGDSNFFNLRLSEVGDTNGDSVAEILAAAYVGEGASGASSGLFLIDAASHSVVWENRGELTGLDLSSISGVETACLNEQQVILLPDSQAEEVSLIAVEDGEDMGSIQTGLISTSNKTAECRLKEFGNSGFLLVSDNQDLLHLSVEETSAVLEWNYPRITGIVMEMANFTGDHTPDLLIYSKSRQQQGQLYGTRTLYVIDGATEESAWSPYEMDYEDFVLTGGITDIQATTDINGDGYTDILGYIQSPSGNGMDKDEDSKIVVLSGNDGSMLLNQQVLPHDYYYEVYEEFTGTAVEEHRKNTDNPLNKRITSLDVADNSCLSSNPVIIVGCNNDMFIISNEGNLLWTRTYESWHYSNLFDTSDPASGYVDLAFNLISDAGMWGDVRYRVMDDLNKDGYNDLLVAGDNALLIGESSGTSVNDFDMNLRGEKLFDSNGSDTGYWIDKHQACLIDDMDSDGFKDVSFQKSRENMPAELVVISSQTGNELLITVQNGGDGDQSFDLACADFDSDGYADHILYQSWIDGHDGPVVTILSGSDGHILWDYSDFRDNQLFNNLGNFTILPATAVSSVNNDDIPDIALIRILADQPGAQLLLYDVTTNEKIKEIIIEETDPDRKWDQRWHPGVTIKELGDYTGDGHNEVALVAFFGDTSSQKEAQLIIIDVVAEEVVVDFRTIGSSLTEMSNDKIGLVGFSGEVYFLDPSHSFSVSSPDEDSIQTSPMTLSWTESGSSSFAEVYVDNVKVAHTNDNEITMDVAGGQHEVRIRSVDENGRGSWDTVSFSVPQNYTPIIIVIGFLLILVIIAGAMAFQINPVEIINRHRQRGG